MSEDVTKDDVKPVASAPDTATEAAPAAAGAGASVTGVSSVMTGIPAP